MPDPESSGKSADNQWRKLVDRNPRHQGHPANRASATQAIERHAEQRGTYVVGADELSDCIRIRFADDTFAIVAFGFVEHSVEGIPGSELLPIGTWNTVLPEHGDFGLKRREPEIATAACPNCFIAVPLGRECGLCGWKADA